MGKSEEERAAKEGLSLTRRVRGATDAVDRISHR